LAFPVHSLEWRAQTDGWRIEGLMEVERQSLGVGSAHYDRTGVSGNRPRNRQWQQATQQAVATGHATGSRTGSRVALMCI
jgi:hypothetical protein